MVFFRQRLLLNNLRDRGEDVLMTLVGVKTPEIKEDEAKSMLEGLRGLLFEIYKGTDFLEVAQQGGYEKAENMLTKTKALTEEGKEAIKGIKATDREKPYSRTMSNPQKRRQFNPYQPQYNPYQNQQGPPRMQHSFPMMQQAHSAMMQPSTSMMQPFHQQQTFPGPYNNNPFGGPGIQFGIPYQSKNKGLGQGRAKPALRLVTGLETQYAPSTDSSLLHPAINSEVEN